MTKRSLLSAASLLAIFGGSAFLSTPATAAALFACSETQIEYARGAIRAECNCGGETRIVCNGYSIEFVSDIQCYACPS
jgi:hypothetical protein